MVEKLFERYRVKFEKLLEFGFKKTNDKYTYNHDISSDFDVIVEISENGSVSAKVWDKGLDEEYINAKIESFVGGFVNDVRQKFINVLLKIRNFCFQKLDFIFEQTNRISEKICKKYNVLPEYLWKDCNYGVFRNTSSKKWFAIIMDIDKSKLNKIEKGKVEIINIKLNDMVKDYLNSIGFYPAYHMNKKYWISILLDNTLLDDEIIKLIDISYNYSK